MGKNYYLKDRDILDQALEHSWGTSADAKAKERAYNREYYQRHKEEILRKARQAGEGIQRTAQNAYNQARQAARPYTTRAQQGLRSAGYNAQSKLYGTAADAINRAKSAPISINKRGTDPRQVLDNMNSARQHMRQRQRQYGTAANEAAKASRQPTPAGMALSRARANVEDVVGGIGRKIDNVKTAFSNERRQASNPMDRNTIRPYERANEMNDRLYKEAKNRFSNAENRVQESNARAERFRKASDAEGRKYDSEVERAKALRSDPRTSQLAVDARTEADAHLSKAAEYQKMAREAGQETYRRLGESNRAYKNQRRMANRRMNSGAAYNEASKAAARDDRGMYDKRFDSKLARDLQNTKAKARGVMSKAEKAAQQAREDAKKRMKKWFNR